MLTRTLTMTPAQEDTMQAAMINRPSYGLRMKGAKASAAKIDDVANDFEAQFVSQMFSTMFSTVDPNEALGGSDAEEIYQSLLVNEYGKIVAQTGGIGVADQVKRIMMQQQETE